MHAEKSVVVAPEEGLQARLAAEFVKKAKQFDAEITVAKDDQEANAKRSLRLMTLGAKKGDEVVIRAEGEDAEDAEEAVEPLVEFIAKNEH